MTSTRVLTHAKLIRINAAVVDNVLFCCPLA